MQTNKVVKMLAGVAALSSFANAGEVMGVSPVTSASAAFEAKGKDTVKVRFDGRTEFEYSTQGADGFAFRRLRLGAKGTLGSKVYTETVLEMAGSANAAEFGGGDIVFDKAIIGYKVNDAVTITGGYSKVVFGFEETSSSSKGKYIERSRLNDRLDGFGTGNFYDRKSNITAKVKLGGGFSVAGSFADAKDGIGESYFGQVRWSNDNITAGIDYADNTTREAFTAYVNYEQGGLNALVEYFDAELVSGALEVDGFVARLSYRFGDFEPIIRYSDYDWGANSDSETLIGFNYYLAPQVTFLAAFVDVEEGPGGGSRGNTDYVIGRLRVLW